MTYSLINSHFDPLHHIVFHWVLIYAIIGCDMEQMYPQHLCQSVLHLADSSSKRNYPRKRNAENIPISCEIPHPPDRVTAVDLYHWIHSTSAMKSPIKQSRVTIRPAPKDYSATKPPTYIIIIRTGEPDVIWEQTVKHRWFGLSSSFIRMNFIFA